MIIEYCEYHRCLDRDLLLTNIHLLLCLLIHSSQRDGHAMLTVTRHISSALPLIRPDFLWLLD
jgi:hypothetical protein